jgi:hypothetical protein
MALAYISALIACASGCAYHFHFFRLTGRVFIVYSDNECGFGMGCASNRYPRDIPCNRDPSCPNTIIDAAIDDYSKYSEALQ